MYKSENKLPLNWSTDPNYTISSVHIKENKINVISRHEGSDMKMNAPLFSKPGVVVQKAYWKWIFVITLLPFYLWGIPVHLLFGKHRITNLREWLKNLFSFWPNPCSGIFTAILLVLTIGWNGYVIYCIGHVVDELVIKADPDISIFSDLHILIRLVPILIPLNYVWVFGYKIRNLIHAFDRIVVPISRQYSTDVPLPVSSSPGGTFKLIIMYIMIIIIHVLHFFLFQHGKPLNTVDDIDDAIYYGMGVIMYNLILPVYSALCWAITYEFQVLASYILILMEDNQPATIELLDNFKRAYKRTADHVLQVNQICSLYLSWVFPVLGFSLYLELLDIGKEFIIIVFNEEPLKEIAVPIRSLVGDFTVILIEVVLLLLTIWQAVKVNDEARYLHVWLNDFVTTPEANLNSEVYMAFRMLKYYVHSRMEQPKPALLYITVLSLVPFLKNRMLNYTVYH